MIMNVLGYAAQSAKDALVCMVLVRHVDLEIDDYKQQHEIIYNNFVSQDHKQPGDSAELAKALMAAVNASNSPRRLLVGEAAVGIIDPYLNGRRSEYEAWREVVAGSDYD